MADEKKPPDDTEKKTESVPEIDPERTVLAPRKKLAPAPPDESDAQSTMMFRRPAEIARPGAAPVEDDRTVVGTAAPRGSLAASARASFQIVVLSGPARGKRFPIAGAEALIGSNPTCDAAIAGIEDVHVKIAKRAQGYELQNLGSSGSVTLTGGRQPNRAELSSGDLLKVGSVVLRVVEMGDVFSPEYSETEFAGKGLDRFLDPAFLRANWWVLAIAAAVVLLALIFWLRGT